MKLPLVVHAKPSLHFVGPLVFIPEGKWIIKSNHINSTLVLDLDKSTLPLKEDMEIEGDVLAQLRFIEVGNEPHITIYAHKCP